MRRALLLIGGVGAVAAAVAWWRRHPRFGAEYMNRVVDPWLVRRGMVEKSRGEIGLLEHVGRRSGVVRVSPVHPVPTESGYRIVVPLGLESHWAQNVLAAGRCRIQMGEVVHELDEPVLVAPSALKELPPLTRNVMDWLGFRYLVLHRVAEHGGTLAAAAEPGANAEREAVAVG